MPKCKNDPTRSYKGTEPSPKGFGYCAHTEKLGKKRKGKDGNIWIVKETIKGSKRWFKYSEVSKLSKKENKPNKVTFPSPPFGIVLIKKGQLGYKKNTRTRLKMGKSGDIYFVAHGNKYIQDKKNKRIFRRRL